MSAEPTEPHSAALATRTGPKLLHHQVEDFVILLVLAAMVLLPLVEIVLRRTVAVGVQGSTSIVQHLTLLVAMLGGALAAREGRLLSLSTGEFLSGRVKAFAQLFSGAIAVAVTALLCLAAAQFVLIEKEAGKTLVYDLPVWVVQLVLPAGFALMTLRLWTSATHSWSGRAVALGIAALPVAAALFGPWTPAQWVLPALIILLVATVMGAPVFVALGGAALILFWGADLPIASLPVDHYRLVINPSLPTIPLFTLAGYFLAEGGASRRLIAVFQALVGQFRGGPAVVTALACAFFTSFTGASGVTILALGGLLMPVLVAARYSERDALGLLTGAGSLGLLFPPCLPLILYAIVAKITIKEMFLGGILPGILLVVMTAWWGMRRQPPETGRRRQFNRAEALRAVSEAKWELLLPVVALASLFGGIATPVEAAALTALYAFVVEVFLYRDLRIGRDFMRVLTETGLLVGGVLLILGVALGFTNYLIDAEIPMKALEWTTAAIHSPWVFLLLLNVFLLIVGCLMDIFSATVVVVPLIVPIGEAFGIDPVHLGIIFLANLELGYLTPPVGMNLFLSSYRFKKPLSEVYRAAFPMLIVLLIGVLLITYIPALTTTLPGWFGR